MLTPPWVQVKRPLHNAGSLYASSIVNGCVTCAHDKDESFTLYAVIPEDISPRRVMARVCRQTANQDVTTSSISLRGAHDEDKPFSPYAVTPPKRFSPRRVIVRVCRRTANQDGTTSSIQHVLGSALASKSIKTLETWWRSNFKLVALGVPTCAQDALDVTQRLVDLADDLFGRKHGVYASALNDQALMLKSVGELAAATDTYLKALEVKNYRIVGAFVYVGEGIPTHV